MIPTYASCRNIPLDFTVSAISGSADSLTRNIRIQYANRAGRSLLSSAQQVTGSGIRVTLNNGLILDGEEIFWIVISVETTGNETDAAIVAMWQARDNNQEVRRSLPVNIDLTTNDHFVGNRVVTKAGAVLAASDFPSTGMVAGAIAYSPDTGRYYRYDPESYTDTDNRLRSYNAYTEGFGNWVLHNGTNLAYLAATTNQYGKDVRIENVVKSLKIPPKFGNDNSTPLRYWLNNEFVNDGGSPLINTQYTFSVSVNGIPNYEAQFNNRIAYYVRGYVDRNTGIVNTAITDVNVRKVWNQENIIKLIDELPRNYAAIVDVVFEFNNDDLLGILPTQTPEIQLSFVEIRLASELSPFAAFIGNLVFPNDDKLLIVPGLKILPGFASIVTSQTQGYLLSKQNEQQILVEAADTPDQQVVIAGNYRDVTIIKLKDEPLQFAQVLRAVISTEPGISTSVVSTAIALSNEGIAVTVNHPVNGLGLGIVRADYSDSTLAGNEKGKFMPIAGYLIVDLDSIFHQSPIQTITNVASQVFTFPDLTNFTIIESVPTQTDNTFSLFAPVSVTVAAATGTLTGNAIAYFYYSYESPNLIATKIDNQAPGTIPVLNSTLAESSNDNLLRSQNLADVPDKPAALVNLNLYSQTVIDVLIGNLNTLITQLQTVTFYQDKALSTLDYTLQPSDHGCQLIISTNISGKIIVPNDVSSFNTNYEVLVLSKVVTDVEYDREDGQQTDLIYTNNYRFQRTPGVISIRRLAGTNEFSILGNLEQ